jgi:hypothetical protein
MKFLCDAHIVNKTSLYKCWPKQSSKLSKSHRVNNYQNEAYNIVRCNYQNEAYNIVRCTSKPSIRNTPKLGTCIHQFTTA